MKFVEIGEYFIDVDQVVFIDSRVEKEYFVTGCSTSGFWIKDNILPRKKFIDLLKEREKELNGQT
jgi:hypothetical protein